MDDRADAEAITEAAMRPTVRFAAVKSANTQAGARPAPFRTHRCLVRQPTQPINALRGHLAEFGPVASNGPASPKLPENALGDETADLPDPVREMGTASLEQTASLTEAIARLAAELEVAAKTDEEPRRPCTIPGIGQVTAGAVAAFAPDPRRRSTCGKAKPGSVGRTGQTDIRRLPIAGRPGRVAAPTAGWRRSWPAGRRWSQPSRSPTRRRGRSGP
jgi:transposase